MDERTRFFSPSCWVPQKSRDDVMNEFLDGIKLAHYEVTFDQSLVRKENIPYGEGDCQLYDIWGEVNDKMMIFFHGGYWAAGCRKDCLTPVKCARAHGFGFVSVGYGLATEGRTLTDTVQDAVDGLEYLLKKFPNVKQVIVGGHSAGAHLAVHAVARVRDERIRGMLLVSGCYFLKELVGTEIGQDINLTDEQAAENSCDLSLLAGRRLKSLVLLGLQEAPKLIEQNKEFSKKQPDTVLLCKFPLGSHYSVMTNLWKEKSDEFAAVSEYLSQF